jgi:hypothetical protein
MQTILKPWQCPGFDIHIDKWGEYDSDMTHNAHIFPKTSADLQPSAIAADPRQRPKLMVQLQGALRSCHYSRRTEQTYCHWVKRFIFFHNVRHPMEWSNRKLMRF